MNIDFEINAYLNAVNEKAHLSDENKIFNHVTASLQFKYVDVSFQEFKQKYSTDGWFGRIIIAVPAAIWSGIVKTIYHLAKGILGEMIDASEDSKYLEAHFFYVARDLQESVGWLATLLNDSYGQYLVQESEFHKSCYDCFLTHSIQYESPLPDDKSYRQEFSIPKTPSFQKTFQSYPYYQQTEFHLRQETSDFSAFDSSSFTLKGSQPSDKQSVINKVMSDPNSFLNLNYDQKNDEDIVASALIGCKSAEQAKKVISSAYHDAKNSKKVAFALVKIDPTLLEQLNYDAKNDEDIIAAAISNCISTEQAKKVINSANYNPKSSKQVALALVKIDPNLLKLLNYDVQHNEDVVAAALVASKTAGQPKDEFLPKQDTFYFPTYGSTLFTDKTSQASDKQSIINKVMSDPDCFQSLNYDHKNDEDIVAAALTACKSTEQAKKVIYYANHDAKNSIKVAHALVKIDPTLLGQLNSNPKNDEDVVIAALTACKSTEQAKKVIYCANHDAKDSKKVGIALVKIDPTLLGQLNYNPTNDEDVVAAALRGCTNVEQAKKVMSSASHDPKNSIKVALVLVKIDPTLLGLLNYRAKNDLNVVLLAIELSTEHTIHKIWSYVGTDAMFDRGVRTKVKTKYPNFFQTQTFGEAFPSFFPHGTFHGFPSSQGFSYSSHRFSSFNPQIPPSQTPHSATKKEWTEPDDLKGNTSNEANIVRSILKQNHLLGMELTKIDLSKEIAKGYLRQLLKLDIGIADKDLKKAYQKAVLRIHPDKLNLQSGEEAFKLLTLAYKQADL